MFLNWCSVLTDAARLPLLTHLMAGSTSTLRLVRYDEAPVTGLQLNLMLLEEMSEVVRPVGIPTNGSCGVGQADEFGFSTEFPLAPLILAAFL